MSSPSSSGESRAPLFAGAALLAATGAFSAFAPLPVTDNSVETLLERGDPAEARWAELRRDFGSDEVILARLEGGELSALLRELERLTNLLEAHPAVLRVLGPRSVHPEAFELLDDPLLGGPGAVPELAWTFDGPLGRELRLFSTSPPAATLYALVAPGPSEERTALLHALETRRAAAARAGIGATFAGAPVLNEALEAASREVESRALPALAALCLVVLALILQSPRRLLALLLPVGLGTLVPEQVFGLLGGRTNLLVAVSRPLLFAVLLATALHVVLAHAALGRAAPRWSAPFAAAREKARPAMLALITTAVGFGSLVFAPTAPVRSFGMVVGGGLLFGIPLLLLGLPACLALVGPTDPPRGASRVAHWAEALAAAARARGRLALGSGVAMVRLGVAALPLVEIEPHAIRYFAPDHPARADHDTLAAAGFGTASVEVLLTAPAPWLTSSTALARADALARDARAHPGVQAVLGLPAYLREASYQATRRDALPDPAFTALLLEGRAGELAGLTAQGGRVLRLTLLIDTLDAAQLEDLREALASAFTRHFPDAGASLAFTGSYLLLLSAQRSILETLFVSFPLTVLAMQLFLTLGLGSLRLGLAALLPNLVPVAVVFAVMALAGVPLDLGTSMVAAIALGIAVDGTLHFAATAQSLPLEETARTTGRAILLAALVIAAGFFALLTTDFAPTRRFGLLTGIAVLTGVLADLWVLPPLLERLGRFDPRSGSDETRASTEAREA